MLIATHPQNSNHFHCSNPFAFTPLYPITGRGRKSQITSSGVATAASTACLTTPSLTSASRRCSRPPCLSLQGAAVACRFHQLLWRSELRDVVWPCPATLATGAGFHQAAISHSLLSVRLSLSSCPWGGGPPSRMQMSSSARFRLSSRWPSDCYFVEQFDLGAVEFVYCSFSFLVWFDECPDYKIDLLTQKWYFWVISFENLIYIDPLPHVKQLMKTTNFY